MSTTRKSFAFLTQGMILGTIMGCSPGSDGPVSKTSDPYRAEFMTACQNKPEYKSRDAAKVKKNCSCIFDQTMKDLTEAEKLTATFYLYAQSGIKVQDREDFKNMAGNTMAAASAAVGKAVRTCGRP